jgi:importin-7
MNNADQLQIGMAMRTLSTAEVKVKSYKIHLMEMVINAIYYNPVSSIYLA